MKDIIITLLEAVITVSVPIIAAYLAGFLKKSSAQVEAKTENERAKHYIEEVTEAVTTAVTATSQTYVDALKNKNMFTKEAQVEALEKAKNTAVAIISPAAAEFITEVYGDLEMYLTAKIEEAVRVQKTEAPALLSAPVATLESTAE
jgi:hypothetical protein